jgi:ABC-type sugar transport system ATPase subunit
MLLNDHLSFRVLLKITFEWGPTHPYVIFLSYMCSIYERMGNWFGGIQAAEVEAAAEAAGVFIFDPTSSSGMPIDSRQSDVSLSSSSSTIAVGDTDVSIVNDRQPSLVSQEINSQRIIGEWARSYSAFFTATLPHSLLNNMVFSTAERSRQRAKPWETGKLAKEWLEMGVSWLRTGWQRYFSLDDEPVQLSSTAAVAVLPLSVQPLPDHATLSSRHHRSEFPCHLPDRMQQPLTVSSTPSSMLLSSRDTNTIVMTDDAIRSSSITTSSGSMHLAPMRRRGSPPPLSSNGPTLSSWSAYAGTSSSSTPTTTSVGTNISTSLLPSLSSTSETKLVSSDNISNMNKNNSSETKRALHPVLAMETETRAANLSGGFAQSVALARVFLRKSAQVVILDEALGQVGGLFAYGPTSPIHYLLIDYLCQC